MRTIICLLKTVFYLLGAKSDTRRVRRMAARGDELTARLLIKCRVQHWALAMLRFAGVTVDVYGMENIPKKTVLFAPNHQSDWDIMLVLSYLDQCGLLSKQEIGKIPLIRTWMDFLHVEYIDRKDARQSIRALRACEKHLLNQENYIIFPEGTRSKSEEIGEFKAGALRMAAKHGIPIVPVSIDGSYKIMEANSGKWIRPGHVIITIQPPVETEDMDKAAVKALGTTIRQSVADGRETGRKLYNEKITQNQILQKTDTNTDANN